MSPNPLFIRPWPLWKRMLQKLWETFEWGDDEYLRFTIGHYPFTAWVTAYTRDSRRSWHRRLFPWRLRFAWASLLCNYVCSVCTVCNSRFSLRELLSRDDSLTRFQSGSICHRDCPPARVGGGN